MIDKPNYRLLRDGHSSVLQACKKQSWIHLDRYQEQLSSQLIQIHNTNQLLDLWEDSNMCTLLLWERESLPDPTARMAAWGGFTTAQNCLIPKGPPKLDTVNVPPCQRNYYQLSFFPKDGYNQGVCEWTLLPHNLLALSCSLLLSEPMTELLLQLWTDLSCLRPGIKQLI